MNATLAYPSFQQCRSPKPDADLGKRRIMNAIAANEILSRLQPDSKLRLTAGAHLHSIRRDEIICRSETPAIRSWLVLSGEVKLVKYTTRGATLLIDLILPNQLFGTVFYECHPVYPCTAVAMRDTELLGFKTADVLQDLHDNPALQRFLLNDVCRKLCRAQQMRGLSLERAPVRIASLLLYLHEKFGPVIPETRETVADLAGTTVETAIRVTSRMARQGAIQTSRSRIKIISLSTLKAWAEGEEPDLYDPNHRKAACANGRVFCDESLAFRPMAECA